MTPESFIARWEKSGAAERANYQLFLTELCTLLDVPQPDPTQALDADNAYVFERNVRFLEPDGSHTIGRIDLYRRGSFVLEAKQGSDADTPDDEAAEALQAAEAKSSAKKSKKRGTAVRGTKGWDDAMVRARGQADRYARAVAGDDGWPPFLIVVDVGHSIELYSDFSRSGKTYVQFPDPQSFRISLGELTRDDIRSRLRQIWLDPLALDPSRRAAKVTRELAERLAELAKLLEKAKHDAEDVAKFLMRCLFTMFAEDVELIPRGSFKNLLADLRDEPENFKPAAEDLWRTMNTGGYSSGLRKRLLKFNGGLFAESEALPLTKPMLALLHEAAGADWTDVEPAIFGTLLERALDPIERHKLGAHYTPRAYVERLVLPTVIEPLREDWQAAYAVALSAAKQGDLEAAQQTVDDFHEKLCEVRVLDPACGSGNFLYVTLEQMKRLEGEVLNALREFGQKQTKLTEVDPHQFLGIEVNPRAAAIADLVLWIGYLQWHFRTRGHAAPAEPIIKNYKNIECRDAVLAWDRKEAVLDEKLQPVTRWNGRTMIIDPVTGAEIPDEKARVLVERLISPRKSEWPNCEFIVGNPPFVANRNMRQELGDGYVEALATAFPEITQAVDLVMYFLRTAGVAVASGSTERAGLITTSRLRMQQNQSVVREVLGMGCSIAFAIPDHPWRGDDTEASVRVAMTVLGRSVDLEGHPRQMLIAPDHDSPARGNDEGELRQDAMRIEWKTSIPPDLSISTDISKLVELQCWNGLCHAGMKPYAKSLIRTQAEARKLFTSDEEFEGRAPLYLNGQDVARTPRKVRVLDFFGFTEADLKTDFPEAYQYLYDYTRKERSQERNPRLKKEWWLFEANRPEMRNSISDTSRYIVTVENSPMRYFVFLESAILPDQKLRVISSDDAFLLGSLSTRIHAVFATRAGGRHGVGNTPVYNSRCCNTFALPAASEELKARIRELGEQLDAHRKRQQALHPKLTLTDMYNVLEKLRSGEELTAKEKTTHEQGLVSVLKQIHDDLDAAVFDAYGWPATLTDEEILERLVALNAERAEEESRGIVRWLRPESQNPTDGGPKQKGLALVDDDRDDAPDDEPAAKQRGRGKGKPAAKEPVGPAKPAKAAKREWPKTREAQAKAVAAALRDADDSVTPDELAKRFTRAQRDTIEELLQAMATLGLARKVRGGKYAG